MPAKRRVPAGHASRTKGQKKRSQEYILDLYVAGVSRKSTEAIRVVTEICDELLKGRYHLEIIDILRQPVMLQGAQIVAAPTLIRKFPLPMKRLTGSMADKDRLLRELDVSPLL